jgi:nicotinic acid mononucleotide adenylyltransferase
MGSDLVASFRSWSNGEKLDDEVNFIVVNRYGYDLADKVLPKHNKVLYANFDGSSTLLRKRICSQQSEKRSKMGLAINGLTTNSVIRYITEKGLYQ